MLVGAWLTLIAVWVLFLAGCSADAVARAGPPPSNVSTALDNGMVRVGVDLNAGGSISYVSRSGSTYNLVNVYDKGRYVQQSYYAGHMLDRTSEGQNSRWSPWAWNPIQGGDSYRNSPPVLAWSNDGRAIYVRTQPLLWDMNRETCQCYFESWISLDGRTVRVRNRLRTFRTDSRWSVLSRNQELPAVYAIADLHRVVSYTGGQPFNGRSLTQIADTPSFWELWTGTEHWSACVNAQGFGLGVYSPPRTTFGGGLYGSPGGGERDSSTCFLAGSDDNTLAKTSVYTYEYYLTVGTLAEIRQDAYRLEQILPTGRTSEESWGFDRDSNLEGWTTSSSVASAAVKSGLFEGIASGNDPYMVSPTIGKSASSLKKVIVRLRNGTANTHAQLFFETLASPAWTPSKSRTVTIRPHSDFTTYTFDMSTHPEWTGTVKRLRLDPASAAGSFGVDWIRIRAAGG